jgi:excisionase family DNA binding protein
MCKRKEDQLMAAVFCGTTDVASRLGCSAEWVRTLTNEGRIPAERMQDGRRIYRISDIDKFLAERAARGQANTSVVRKRRNDGRFERVY